MQFLLSCFFCLTLLFSYSLIPLQAATVHAIMAADTADWSIGPCIKNDLKAFKQLAKRVADATDLTLEAHVFKGFNYTPEGIVACIEALNVSPDDVILYFHSSHGVRTYAMGLNPLPILEFDSPVSLYLSDIAKLIEEKKPRLSVILADCCHKWGDHTSPIMMQVFPKTEKDTLDEYKCEQYKRLFLNPSGTIILLAAAPGCSAYTLPSTGGYFTQNFMSTLTHLAKQDEPITWKSVLDETHNVVKQLSTTPPAKYDFPFKNRPQYTWYSINIDTENAFTSIYPAFLPKWTPPSTAEAEESLLFKEKQP